VRDDLGFASFVSGIERPYGATARRSLLRWTYALGMPSSFGGTPTTRLACRAPRLGGALPDGAFFAPPVLELTDGQRIEASTFDMALRTLKWMAEACTGPHVDW
jgi:hypothetical protein